MAAAIAITRTGHTAAQLRELAGTTRDGAVVRHLLALILESRPCTEAAEQSGMEQQTLPEWFTATTRKESTVSKWLRKLRLTRLQPRPFHPRKDVAAQEAL